MNRGAVDLDTLFHLQARARAAGNRKILGFVIVNETRSVLRYRQAILWDRNGKPTAISGVSEPESNAPFVLWLRELFQALRKVDSGGVSQDAFAYPLIDSWRKWLPSQGVWISFNAFGGGGVLFAREDPWSEEETRVLTGLAETYGDIENTFPARAKHPSTSVHWTRRRTVVAIALSAVVFSGFYPVPLTVLAPAEIVAVDPEVVRAPLDGVIATMHIRPNERISAGQPLFDLDDVGFQRKLDVTEKALAAARAEFEQAAQKALYDPSEKARLALLGGRVAEQETEVSFLEDILSRIEIVATRDGIAIIDDTSEWIGRPVTVGERIMAISDERDTEVEAWLAVGDALEMDPGAPVTVFLNSSPLEPLAARLRYAAYRAQSRPDGTLAYRIRAQIQDSEKRPRLGLRGTARIEAGRAALIYWLLRRPLAKIRQSLGV